VTSQLSPKEFPIGQTLRSSQKAEVIFRNPGFFKHVSKYLLLAVAMTTENLMSALACEIFG